MMMDDNKSKLYSHSLISSFLIIEIGLGLIVLSIFFFLISMLFMLDRAFMVMANVSYSVRKRDQFWGIELF